MEYISKVMSEIISEEVKEITRSIPPKPSPAKKTRQKEPPPAPVVTTPAYDRLAFLADKMSRSLERALTGDMKMEEMDAAHRYLREWSKIRAAVKKPIS